MSKLPNVVQLFECSKRQITFPINVFLFNTSVRPLLLQFALQASWSTFYQIAKGRRQKKWYFWLGGEVRGPTTTFGQKSTTFCFCIHSMQKPSKRVKTQ